MSVTDKCNITSMKCEDKYSQVLELAASLYQSTEDKQAKAVIEYIFPELATSDDELTRQEIIDLFKNGVHTSTGKEAARMQRFLDWVETHTIADGSYINVDEVRADFMNEAHRILDAEPTNDRANQIIGAFDALSTIEIKSKKEVKHTCNNCRTFREMHQNCPYSPIFQYKDVAEATKHLDDETNCAFFIEDKEHKPKLPKPKFQVGDTMRTIEDADIGITSGLPVVESIDDEYYHCNNELIAIKDQDKYEYPPMNKCNNTEGRFQIGDWISNGSKALHINNKKNGLYIFNSDELGLPIEYVDNRYHFWTIDDAKPGDVLIDTTGVIMIFKKRQALMFATGIYSYCTLFPTGELSLDVCIYYDICCQPAGINQRAELFDKIKEAGYEWDRQNLKMNPIRKPDHLKVKAVQNPDPITDSNDNMPKFEIGQWITDGKKKAMVLAVYPQYYLSYGDLDECAYGDIKTVNDNYHAWTIKDCVPGDIITSGWETYMFKELHPSGNRIKAFCHIEKCGTFYNDSDRNVFFTPMHGKFNVADKEARQELEDAMLEYGLKLDLGQQKLVPVNNNRTPVKPKFQEGDWITNGSETRCIQFVENGIYFFEDEDGTDVEDIDKEFHLWSIKDAKTGDILSIYHTNTDAPLKIIFIFDHAVSLTKYECKYFCYYNPNVQMFGSHPIGTISTDVLHLKPATPGQKNTLFNAMNKAGYMWDDVNMKLCKIAEEPKFHVNDIIVHNETGDMRRITCINDKNNYYIYVGFRSRTNMESIAANSDSFKYIHENYHLWNITTDADPGDILVNGDNVFIFKCIDNNRVMAYCHVNTGDNTFTDDSLSNDCFGTIDAPFSIAIPIEKEKLFETMKTAGYEWDKDELMLIKLASDEDSVMVAELDAKQIRDKHFNDLMHFLNSNNITDEAREECIEWLKSVKKILDEQN